MSMMLRILGLFLMFLDTLKTVARFIVSEAQNFNRKIGVRGADFVADVRTRLSIRFVNDSLMYVNLDARPRSPSYRLNLQHVKVLDAPATKKGWVKVERRISANQFDDDLYVDNRRVVLHLDKKQLYEVCKVSGSEVLAGIAGNVQVHPNILDALLIYPSLIPSVVKWSRDLPKDWRRYAADEKISRVYFSSMKFRDNSYPNSDFYCIRCIRRDLGHWVPDYEWASFDFGPQDYIATYEG